MLSTAALLNALLWLVIVGLILYVCWWGLQKIALPEPFNKVAVVVLVLITVVILVNFLLGLTGAHLFR
jgi:uncharacterized membrane protein YwzB